MSRDDRVNLDEIPDQTFLGHKLEREQDLITVYKNDEVDELYTALQGIFYKYKILL